MCHHLVISSLETTRLLWYWCLSSSNHAGFHVFGFTVLWLQTTNLCWHKTCLKSNAFKIFAQCCTWNFQNHKDSNRFRYKIAFPFGQSWGDLYHMRLYAVVCMRSLIANRTSKSPSKLGIKVLSPSIVTSCGTKFSK